MGKSRQKQAKAAGLSKGQVKRLTKQFRRLTRQQKQTARQQQQALKQQQSVIKSINEQEKQDESVIQGIVQQQQQTQNEQLQRQLALQNTQDAVRQGQQRTIDQFNQRQFNIGRARLDKEVRQQQQSTRSLISTLTRSL